MPIGDLRGAGCYRARRDRGVDDRAFHLNCTFLTGPLWITGPYFGRGRRSDFKILG